MKKHYLILLFILIGSMSRAQQTIEATITHDGIERAYILYVPASYDPAIPTPLILCFHGFGSTADNIAIYSGFNRIADTANFLIAYPQGTLLSGTTHWNVGGWTTESTTNDVGFAEALLDSISADYTIDNKKVYATGMSNGGFMSFLLACQLSERIAAIASVTGSMTPETYNACNPQHPVPVLQFHGTSDGTVPYTGAFYSKPINEVLQFWIGFNKTNTEADRTDIEDTNTADGSTAERIQYTHGDSCSSVVHYKISGGGHDWPGVWGNLDINASALIWNFFSQYDLNGKLICEEAEEGDNGEEEEEETDPILTPNHKPINNSFKVYPNPSNAFITIESEYLVAVDYEIRSVQGKLVLKGLLTADNKRISISKLKAGIYLLKIGEDTVKFVKED